MSIHIIIDGYNLIRQSKRLSGFEQQDIKIGRDALIQALTVYKKKKHHKISVVFDGAGAPFLSPRRNSIKGIEIMFSRAGDSADDVIKRMVAKEKEKALVVSSDRDIMHYATSNGATAVTSSLFEEKLILSAPNCDNGIDAANDYGWTPSTKKKGPGRRLSKRERKNRLKTGKL